MAPVGLYERRDGEQVLVHRCWDCGIERSNRVAADDDGAVMMRLALLPGRRPADRVDLDEWSA
jgi:RNHCP domain-containing protein